MDWERLLDWDRLLSSRKFDELFDLILARKIAEGDVWLVDREGVVYLPSRPIKLKARPRERGNDRAIRR